MINKRLLVATVAAALLTGGYYASAQGLPHITLGAPTVGPTTSYAPGTPAWLEYAGSPYRIGGPKGPQPGETWEQFQYHAQPVASGSPSTVHGTPSTGSANASTTSASPYSAATTPAAPGANSPNPTNTELVNAPLTALPSEPPGWKWVSAAVPGGNPFTRVWIPIPGSWWYPATNATTVNLAGLGTGQITFWMEGYQHGISVVTYPDATVSQVRSNLGVVASSDVMTTPAGTSFARTTVGSSGTAAANQAEWVSSYVNTSGSVMQTLLIADGQATIQVSTDVRASQQAILSTIFTDLRFVIK